MSKGTGEEQKKQNCKNSTLRNGQCFKIQVKKGANFRAKCRQTSEMQGVLLSYCIHRGHGNFFSDSK